MADIDFDAVLTQIGERGPFQRRLFYLLCIPASLPAIFVCFSQVFVSATPDHWCRVPELDATLAPEETRSLAIPYTLKSDGTREYSRCEVYDVNFTQLLQETLGEKLVSDLSWNTTKCHNGWHYDRTYFDETLVSELDIVCDKSWWIATSTTCFYVGSLLGNVVFGIVGDRLGRRTAFLLVVLWHVMFSVATSFSSNYIMYTALRSLNALVFPAIYQVPFVLAIEVMGPKHRTYAGMMMCVFFALGLGFLAVLTFLLRDWFSLLFYTSVPFVFLFGYYWLIPESPRWLLSKGRVDEAEVIVQRMAKVNGCAIPSQFLRSFQSEKNTDETETERSKLQDTEEPKHRVDLGLIDLLRRPILRRGFIVIAFDWITNAMVYSGLAFNSANLGVRSQTAFLIGASVELPSYIFSWWAMDRYGRRYVIWACMLLGGLSCVSCAFVPDVYVWVIFTLAMIGRFGISASFAVLYVFVGEILPTVVRSQSMACASFIGNIGLLLFPSIIHLANYWRMLPLLVFGSLSVAGALATTLLPETLGCPLPQTLDDGEILYKKTTKDDDSRCGGCFPRPAA